MENWLYNVSTKNVEEFMSVYAKVMDIAKISKRNHKTYGTYFIIQARRKARVENKDVAIYLRQFGPISSSGRYVDWTNKVRENLFDDFNTLIFAEEGQQDFYKKWISMVARCNKKKGAEYIDNLNKSISNYSRAKGNAIAKKANEEIKDLNDKSASLTEELKFAGIESYGDYLAMGFDKNNSLDFD